MARRNEGIDRRSIFRCSLHSAAIAGAASLPSSALQAQPSTEARKILNQQSGMRYRAVGDTGIHLSVISLGGLVMMEPVHHYAIDRGVNLVHISDNYLGGRAIVALGNVLRTRRKDVYLAVKDNFRDIDQTLKTLNTDYIDFIMFNRHKADEAGDPGIREQFERWKQQGKVRYAGLTVHGEVKETVGVGLASGMYTMVNPALNQPNLEAMQEELRVAHQKRVAVMAMKTMRGLKDINLETAYLKKVLLNPAVTTVVKGIGSFEMFDAYLKAANEALTAREDRALYRYAQANRTNNCMFCDECRSVCPDGVEISTVLRCKDYYHDQLGDRLTAESTYRALPAWKLGGSQCELCHACEVACPNGIHIVNRLIAARALFDERIST
jgi:uncharacterized protein